VTRNNIVSSSSFTYGDSCSAINPVTIKPQSDDIVSLRSLIYSYTASCLQNGVIVGVTTTIYLPNINQSGVINSTIIDASGLQCSYTDVQPTTSSFNYLKNTNTGGLVTLSDPCQNSCGCMSSVSCNCSPYLIDGSNSINICTYNTIITQFVSGDYKDFITFLNSPETLSGSTGLFTCDRSNLDITSVLGVSWSIFAIAFGLNNILIWWNERSVISKENDVLMGDIK
jgi:hypothetical protein